jgi:site-specific recombinase XerD
MIKEMDIRGISQLSKKAYLRSMEYFMEWSKTPPARLGLKDIKEFQHYLLKERGLAANSINRHLSGIRFFYRHVLGRHWYSDALPRLKITRSLPVVLSEEEVGRMIDSVHNVFWKAVVMTLYSSGIRHAELRNLKACDIDSKRMVINIRKGKGGQDRQALLSPVTLKCLRTYWRLFRKGAPPTDYLFTPTKNSRGVLNKRLSHTAIGYIVGRVAEFAGIKKKSIHTPFAIPLLSTCLNAA